MRKSFFTGLVLLLPLALTLAIIFFIFNLLTAPFLGIVKSVFGHYGLFKEGFLFLSPDQIQNLIAQILILVCLFFIVIGLGYFARWFFFHTLIKYTDEALKKIPVVNKIYKACKEVIKSLFTSKTKSFRQVVLVPFPNAETYSIGLISREEIPGLAKTDHAESIAVFVPTTPNPTAGFLMMFKQKDVVYLDMKVEEAFKFIISCGMIFPAFKAITKEEAHERFIQAAQKNILEEI